jgi:hypothetical protein
MMPAVAVAAVIALVLSTRWGTLSAAREAERQAR